MRLSQSLVALVLATVAAGATESVAHDDDVPTAIALAEKAATALFEHADDVQATEEQIEVAGRVLAQWLTVHVHEQDLPVLVQRAFDAAKATIATIESYVHPADREPPPADKPAAPSKSVTA